MHKIAWWSSLKVSSFGKVQEKSIAAIPMHLVRKRNKNKEIVIFGGEGMILCMNSMSNYW
jgi:hypothetical protein